MEKICSNANSFPGDSKIHLHTSTLEPLFIGSSWDLLFQIHGMLAINNVKLIQKYQKLDKKLLQKAKNELEKAEKLKKEFVEKKSTKNTLIVILHKSRSRMYTAIIASIPCFVQLYGPKGQILTIL